MSEEIIDDIRRIVNNAMVQDPRLYRLLDEAERRLKNGSETIAEYQRLTQSDYPGTFAAYLANGRFEDHGRAQRPIPNFRYVVGGEQ